jgi:cytochrome c peroxidase
MRGLTYLMMTMYYRIVFIVVCGVALIVSGINGCASAPATPEKVIRTYFNRQTDSLLFQLTVLDSSLRQRQPLASLQEQFARCRFLYKTTEAITEYYFQGLTKRINGPALPEVKTEDGQVWPPHGFQVIEQYLYDNYSDSLAAAVSNEVRLLQTDLRFVRANMEHNAILPQHQRELTQHALIRIAVLGITGFDAPLSQLSLIEAKHSLEGLMMITRAYAPLPDSSKIFPLFRKATEYLDAHTDFASFDRMAFLRLYLMPMSEVLFALPHPASATDSLMVRPFFGSLSDLLKGTGWNADYYATYANAATNNDKVTLGRQLFFDPLLSNSGTISCGSCHQPDLFFTDGRKKAGDFIHGGTLARNTPTIYYAALQSHQFYDMRSTTLEDQADQVMRNTHEFNFTGNKVAGKLSADTGYLRLFRKAFPGMDTISAYTVRNALGAYVRSLSPFASRFDQYLRGSASMNAEEIHGFNLFAGKAKCATCHFIPLFNGNIPPWYVRSESEIIGVPLQPLWEKARIDTDSGRYTINRMDELMFAFKTPGIRNIEKTGPYMHNGVYATLEEVVQFYQKGGGVGIGIDLPFQSLPFDTLSLDAGERKALVAFMKTLTDYSKP